MDTPIVVGTEWLIEASGCEQSALRDKRLLQLVFADVIGDLGLKTVGREIWHKFPGAGGVTGLIALTESHLACHTYPEHGIATFNLYCCKDRPFWNWEERLGDLLGAVTVTVRKIPRSAPESLEKHETNREKGHHLNAEMSAAGGEA